MWIHFRILIYSPFFSISPFRSKTKKPWNTEQSNLNFHRQSIRSRMPANRCFYKQKYLHAYLITRNPTLWKAFLKYFRQLAAISLTEFLNLISLCTEVSCERYIVQNYRNVGKCKIVCNVRTNSAWAKRITVLISHWSGCWKK